MPSHKIVLKSVSPQCDLKKLVLYISEIKKCSTNQAIDWVKHLPLTLFSNCPEQASQRIVAELQSLNAIVECSPPLHQHKKPTQKVRSTKKTATKQELKGTWRISFGIIFGLCIIGLAIMIPTIHWVYTVTRPKDEKSLIAAKKGSQLIGQKKYDKASALLRKNIKENPYNTAPYITEAINLISKARNIMDSTEWSGYAAPKQTNTHEPGGYENIPKTGIDRLPLPEASKAIQILKKALSLEPNNPEIYRWLGYIYQQKGLYNNAQKYMKKAIALSPKTILYKNLLGNLYIETQHYAKADYVFRQALDLDTSNIHTLKNLGLLNQFYLNDTNLAQHYYYRYMRNDPVKQNDFDINIIKQELMKIIWNSFNTNPFPPQGKTNMRFSLYESQRKKLEKMIQSSKSANATEAMALLFAKNGKHREAKDYFQKTLIINPEQYSVYRHLALLHASEGELTVTAMMLNRAEREGSKDPFIYKNLALFEKYYNNNPERAQNYYKLYRKYGSDSEKIKMMREFSN